MNHPNTVFLSLLLSFFSSLAFANDDAAMAAMQQQLNAEVMAQPFDPGDVAKVDAYIADAMKNNIKPVAKRPSYWQPGYTCNYIRQYRYDYHTWRNCRYYHRYYGRYW